MNKLRAVPALFAAALTLAALSLSPSIAQAQQQERPCRDHGRRGDPAAHLDQRLQNLTQKLGLDARQVTRIRAIFQESMQRRQAVRAMPRGTDQQRQARQDLRTWMHARIRSVLTPAQQTTFDQMRAEHRRHRDGRGGRGGHGHQGDRTSHGDV